MSTSHGLGTYGSDQPLYAFDCVVFSGYGGAFGNYLASDVCAWRSVKPMQQ